MTRFVEPGLPGGGAPAGPADGAPPWVAAVVLVGLAMLAAFGLLLDDAGSPPAPPPRVVPAALLEVLPGGPVRRGRACLATAVSTSLAVTTASCAVRIDGARQRGEEAVVRPGSGAGAPRWVIDRVMRHPAYDPATGTADVALLALEGPALAPLLLVPEARGRPLVSFAEGEAGAYAAFAGTLATGELRLDAAGASPAEGAPVLDGEGAFVGLVTRVGRVESGPVIAALLDAVQAP